MISVSSMSASVTGGSDHDPTTHRTRTRTAASCTDPPDRGGSRFHPLRTRCGFRSPPRHPRRRIRRRPRFRPTSRPPFRRGGGLHIRAADNAMGNRGASWSILTNQPRLRRSGRVGSSPPRGRVRPDSPRVGVPGDDHGSQSLGGADEPGWGRRGCRPTTSELKAKVRRRTTAGSAPEVARATEACLPGNRWDRGSCS